jgi:hypothetical protein
MPGNPRINLFINQHNVEKIQDQKHTVKFSEILKNASEEQCFGHFMKISESSNRDKDHQTKSITKSIVKVCVNGLLMSKARIGDVSSSPLSIYEYIADGDDILGAYRTLGIDPYYRIKCNKCNLLGDRYHLYRVLEHMNDHHHASFKEIGSYLETLGL